MGEVDGPNLASSLLKVEVSARVTSPFTAGEHDIQRGASGGNRRGEGKQVRGSSVDDQPPIQGCCAWA